MYNISPRLTGLPENAGVAGSPFGVPGVDRSWKVRPHTGKRKPYWLLLDRPASIGRVLLPLCIRQELAFDKKIIRMISSSEEVPRHEPKD
jgi:hypothetical protein